MRMDKYKDENNDEETLDSITTQEEFSRTEKNNRIYHETYLNSSVIDASNVSSIFNDENVEETLEEEIPKEIYIEKNYDVDDYIEKARENRENDNLMRSLVDTDYDVNKVNEKKDEISKLIEKIEEREQQEDFFSDLLPDNSSDTVVTDPVMEEDSDVTESIDDVKLETMIGDNTFIDYAKREEEKIKEDESFKDIMETKGSKKLPLIVFIVSAIILVVVIVLILLK